MGEELMEWLNTHFIEPSSEEGDHLSSQDRPWEDELFWPYLTRYSRHVRDRGMSEPSFHVGLSCGDFQKHPFFCWRPYLAILLSNSRVWHNTWHPYSAHTLVSSNSPLSVTLWSPLGDGKRRLKHSASNSIVCRKMHEKTNLRTGGSHSATLWAYWRAVRRSFRASVLISMPTGRKSAPFGAFL